MSESAKEFLCKWAAEHVQDEGYLEADGPDPRVARFVAQCRSDAANAGLTPEQLGAAASDLHGASSLERFIAIEIDLSAQKRHNQIVQGDL